MLSLVSFTMVKADKFFAPCRVSSPCDVCIVACKRCCLLVLINKCVIAVFYTTLAVLIAIGVRAPGLTVYVPFFLLYVVPFVTEMLPTFSTFFGLLPAMLAGVFGTIEAPVLFRVNSFMFHRVSLLVFLCVLLFVMLLPLVCVNCDQCKLGGG